MIGHRSRFRENEDYLIISSASSSRKEKAAIFQCVRTNDA